MHPAIVVFILASLWLLIGSAKVIKLVLDERNRTKQQGFAGSLSIRSWLTIVWYGAILSVFMPVILIRFMIIRPRLPDSPYLSEREYIRKQGFYIRKQGFSFFGS